MRTSPPIAPHWPEQDPYIVLDDFGRIRRAWRETDQHRAGREALIRDLAEGQFRNPIRIVVFNTADGWSRDVTLDIAHQLRRRYGEFGEVPQSVLVFMEANPR
jgi:hypothetical protein